MRTRKEIEKDRWCIIGSPNDALIARQMQVLILEVLLDIRDLLEKQNEPNGEPTPEENPMD